MKHVTVPKWERGSVFDEDQQAMKYIKTLAIERASRNLSELVSMMQLIRDMEVAT
jgi:hypothetical protein